MCNLACTSGMINKHHFLLFQLRGTVKDPDGGMLAEQDVFESHQCFVWQFYFSFYLPMERTTQTELQEELKKIKNKVYTEH